MQSINHKERVSQHKRRRRKRRMEPSLPLSWDDFLNLDHGAFMAWLNTALGRKATLYQAALEALATNQAQGLHFDLPSKEAFTEMALSLSNSKPFVVQFAMLVENTLSKVPWKQSDPASQKPPPPPPRRSLPLDSSSSELSSEPISQTKEPNTPSSLEQGSKPNPSTRQYRPMTWTKPISQAQGKALKFLFFFSNVISN
jgi:hypothetical protein